MSFIKNMIFRIFPFPLILLLMLLSPVESEAQLNESMEVEGIYEKEILYPEKLPLLPERRRLTPPESDLPYMLKGVEADFIPSATPIPATIYGATRRDISPAGYLNLELGSWLNASLEAGYTPLSSPEHTLSIWLRHNSTSLWRPFGGYTRPIESIPADKLNRHKRFSYQEAIAANYSRRLAGIGTLDAGIRYRLGYFNYYSVLPTALPPFFPEPPAVPDQTLNDISARIGLAGLNTSSDLWNANLAMRHFAFRTATRETSLILSGGYGRILSPSSLLGIDADFRWMIYSAARCTALPDDYGNLRLTPFFRWKNGMVTLRAGANIYLTFNADGTLPGKHYPVIHASPDVRFDFSCRHIDFWIHALGGESLHTLASAADMNLYCLPELQSTTPVYSPVDARIGARLRILTGLTAEAEVRYAVTRNVAGEGWHMLLMQNCPDYGGIPLPDFDMKKGLRSTFGLGRSRYDLDGFSTRVGLTYTPSEIFKIKGEATYTPQSSEKGIFNGLDRPRWILDAGFTIAPLKSLRIGVDYQYRGVRSVWSAVTDIESGNLVPGLPGSSPCPGNTGSNGTGSRAGGIATPPVPPAQKGDSRADTKACGMRLPDITRLNAHVEWKLPAIGKADNITLGVHARNILNHREILLPGLPTEGITLSGSMQILF